MYGGRGIEVCDRWLEFVNFYEDMHSSFVKHSKTNTRDNTTIDRIDNNGNYNKENCRWATRLEQMSNRGNTVFVNYRGKKVPLSTLTRKSKNIHGTVSQRIKRGWEIEEALTIPPHKQRTK